MPRQPYLQVVGQPRGAKIDVGTQSIGQRPELEALVSNCLMAWPHVEAEMAVLFTQLLGADNAAALAVFQALRRSSAQRDAISEAAKVSLNDTDQELLSAVLNAHKSVETERNALCHGHFGTSTKVPDGLIWMTTNDYLAIRVSMTLAHSPSWDDAKHAKILERIWVYRADDLRKIYAQIKTISQTWFDLVRYFRYPKDDQRLREQRYRQLCDQSHIARELEQLRQKRTPSTPSQ